MTGATAPRARPAAGPVPLRALVVDDEAPAREELLWLLGRDARIARVRAAGSASDALLALDTEPVDVVFCDIKMPGLGGLDRARVLGRFAQPPLVVFVTAYDEHAGDAFDLRATDYVRKPVRPERLPGGGRRGRPGGGAGAARGGSAPRRAGGGQRTGTGPRARGRDHRRRARRRHPVRAALPGPL